jgi:hypothetical protein
MRYQEGAGRGLEGDPRSPVIDKEISIIEDLGSGEE